MIISIEEYQAALKLVELCQCELEQEQIPFDLTIQVGIMVETPAAVINIEDFAEKVDFISIGTNDLTQYLLAVDRGNQTIAVMYNPYHPAVLRSIYRIIEVGHKYKKKVGLCGELASDPKAIKLLLGMGLDEFSMSTSSILVAKDIIRNTNYSDAEKLAQKVLEACTGQEIMELLKSDEGEGCY